MTTPVVLVATWEDGLFVVGRTLDHELRNASVRSLVPLVSASAGHFASQGAIYRRRVDGHDSLVAVGDGLPAWTDGIVDTGCIATHGSAAGLADRKGNLYVSADVGRSWSRHADGLPAPSSVLIVDSQ